MKTNHININELVDKAKFTPFHWGGAYLVFAGDYFRWLRFGHLRRGFALADERMGLEPCGSRLARQHGFVWHDVWRDEFWHAV